MQNQDELASTIGTARKLHGHLGPFLVIGVKMGTAAKKALNVSAEQCTLLKAHAALPLYPPFSCLLDGIQVSTTCTVGNQRLKIENAEDIKVNFTKQDKIRIVKITLKPEMAEILKKKLSENALNEEFAMEIARLPENQLFNVQVQ